MATETIDVTRLPKSQSTKRAIARFKRFWGVGIVPSVLRVRSKRRDRRVFVCLGRSPALYVAEGPKQHPGKQRKVTLRHRLLLVRPNGRGMVVWDTRKTLPIRPRLRFVGYCPVTEYVAMADVERAGSHKRGTLWRHEHLDKGGKWPRLLVDEKGNYHYRGGTYYVTDWIRR